MLDLARRGKHLLVEKPVPGDDDAIRRVIDAAAVTGAVCYTAYNHRFEPHFVRMKEVIASGKLGRIYCARMFYGNGTARLVRDSDWRDRGAGVLPDLGSHLLDTALFWFSPQFRQLRRPSCSASLTSTPTASPSPTEAICGQRLRVAEQPFV